MFRNTFFIICGLCLSSISFAQVQVSGRVLDEQGQPLPFATIYVTQLQTGTTTNEQGFFSLQLAAGTWELVFQYLGYQPVAKTLTVGQEPLDLTITLQPEALVLSGVEITARAEDPAYAIMRKAIAKSKYHLQQLDSMQAQVYIKGSGRLIESPFFVRKKLAEEGIDSTFNFVTESISEISYQRPNTYKQRVLSVRTSGSDNNTSPLGYLTGSFYQPEIAGAISPLSPRAFAYYRFEYLGTFTDRQYAVSKIKVTPRSQGDDVFSGVISIVEDYWSIYNLDLTTTHLGITYRIEQIYNPVQENVWLPVSHRFFITGSVFGFAFEYEYLATVSDYRIWLNPDLPRDIVVIDEKTQKALADSLAKNKSYATNEEKLASGKPVTRKELRKLIREYEKEERQASAEPQVAENYSYQVDSTAYRADSAWWAQVRPVPLSEREIRGYHKLDSLAKAERQDQDSLQNGKGGFSVGSIFTGHTFLLGNNDRLRYYSPFLNLNFNTVEGYNTLLRLRYRHNFTLDKMLEITPEVRYGFNRARVPAKGEVAYYYKKGTLREGKIALAGGRYVWQLNPDNPIQPFVNSLTSLLNKNNYMKLYEGGFVRVAYLGKLRDNLGLNLVLDWQERTALFNTTNHTWIKQSKEYTPNNPANAELDSTVFPYHRALTATLSLHYRPWQKYRIHNGRKSVIRSSSPEFSFTYRKGVPAAWGNTDFDLLELGVQHSLRVGVRGSLHYHLTAGRFVQSRQLYFPDFRHFAGNEAPFLPANPTGSYRLLSYYNFSTGRQYLSALTYYDFRKFLFTQIPVLRMTGVRELVFANYLTTPAAGHYVEAGYGIDNLFRILRVEAAVSWLNGRYNGFGIKVGIAASLAASTDSEDNSITIGL